MRGSQSAQGDCGYNVVLYICLQQRERHTDEAGETEGAMEGEMEGEMLPAACCHLSNVVTVPHYVLF